MPDVAPAAPPSARPASRGPGRRRTSDAQERQSPRSAGAAARAWAAEHPIFGDLALASVVVSVSFFFEVFDQGEVVESLDVADIVAGIAAFALIVLRRQAPLPVLAVALAAGVWSLIPEGGPGVLRVAACLALYTVTSTSGRRAAWVAGTVAGTALFLTATASSAGAWYDGDNLELIAWTGVATAIGDAVRSRRDYLIANQERATALRERAERAEQALEEEARRQVIEERLRIARELHDVVAHHIAVVNVQAGVATHLVRSDPSGAEEALVHVRRGASSVLDELGGILSLMRRADDPTDPTDPMDPLPTIDRLDRLIADFTNVGLDVEWHTSGVRPDVSPAVSLAAFRIIQESLTNAHRHGRSPHAVLRVEYRPDTLVVEVLNDVVEVRLPTGRRGYGILGMRERIAAAGGTIEAGRTGDGRYRVHITLPLTGDDR